MENKFSLALILFVAYFVSCNREVQSIKLSSTDWEPNNKAQIEQLINKYGLDSDNYNPAKPPYVVFDWDNTSIFLDIEEATLMYQLQNLIFGCTPEQLDTILKLGTDTTILLKKENIKGEKFKISAIVSDIIKSYTWIYNNYENPGMHGRLSLEEIKKNPNYNNFITKVRFLYEAISETYSEDVAYPWVTYLFTGLDSSQVHNITKNTIKWQIAQEISIDTLISPSMENQQAGQVQVTWKNGLRLLPEMQELYTKFREAGFDVWICSASFVDVIKEISSNPEFGYNNPPNQVLAMELERDANGKILPIFRKGYYQTQGEGKTAAINRFLASPVTGRYGYDPLFIAGDSPGDENMLADFDGIKLGLIINRLKDKYASDQKNNMKGIILGELYKQADNCYQNQKNCKYLLQGRDDNKGSFIPNRQYIKFGEKNGKVLSSE